MVTHTSQAQTRKNILVIFSDDHTRQAISAYGQKQITTPGIDRIAREGALFTNALVTNSICAPSRATFLTGKYSHQNGLYDNGPRRFFDGQQQQVQKGLSDAGYQTAWIGKWHLESLPQGFDYWQILPGQGHYYNPAFINMQNDTLTYPGYATDITTDFSTRWLDQRDTTKPFFLVIGQKATHREWLPDLPDLGVYDSIDFEMPANFYDRYEDRLAAADQDMTIDKTMRIGWDLKAPAPYASAAVYRRLNPTQKAAFKGYYDGITREYERIKDDSAALLRWKFQRYMKDYLSTARSLDRNVGRVLDYLDSTGLAENTVVIYTSDQGFYLGEHGWFDKRFMYEESLSTPFVMRYPGVIKPGTVVDEMIVNIDFNPTLREIAGAPIPGDVQGKSILPLIQKAKSAKTNWRKSMYYRYYEYPEPHRVAPHIGIRTNRYKLIRFAAPVVSWELYDLKKDPTEMKNIYKDPKQASRIAQLKKELKQLALDYGDTDGAAMVEME